MRKTTIFNYDNVDIRELIRQEVKKAGLDKVPDGLKTIDEQLKNIIKELSEHAKQLTKMDKMYELMDKIAGGIRDYREEQTLMSQKLSDYSDQLENHEKRLKKLEYPAL